MERRRLRIIQGPGVKPEELKPLHALLERGFTEHFEVMDPERKRGLEAHEIKKDDKEKTILECINAETNKLMESYGIEPRDIGEENYHLLPTAIFNDLIPYQKEPGDAHADTHDKGAYISRERAPTYEAFAKVALHETAHLKAHETQYVRELENGSLMTSMYRDGVSALRPPQSAERREFFQGLHEATVATVEKKLFRQMMNSPVFENERRLSETDAMQRFYTNLARHTGIPLEDIATAYDINEGDDYKGTMAVQFSYPKARSILQYVCEEIVADNPEKFRATDDALDVFQKAYFTGNLLEIGRLVEKTFGKGSFRVLGEMTTEEESIDTTRETLTRMRALVK